MLAMCQQTLLLMIDEANTARELPYWWKYVPGTRFLSFFEAKCVTDCNNFNGLSDERQIKNFTLSTEGRYHWFGRGRGEATGGSGLYKNQL